MSHPQPGDHPSSDNQSDIPRIGRPANQALEAAGYHRLDQLGAVTEAEIAALHGMGPKGIRLLKDALAARGLSFAEPS